MSACMGPSMMMSGSISLAIIIDSSILVVLSSPLEPKLEKESMATLGFKPNRLATRAVLTAISASV